MKILNDVNLAQYTSWMVGGNAEYFCIPETMDELRHVLLHARMEKLPFTILGGGSNVLISDQGIPGLTICLRKFSGVETRTENSELIIEALAGTSKTELLKTYLKNKMPPALFLAGLPGDVGGGVVMNAGVAEDYSPREFMELVDWIEVMKADGSIERLYKNQLNVSYRHTDGWQPHIIVKVGMSWPNQPDENILQRVRDANKIRLSRQPLDMPSCGSVFKNPDGHKAAQLIDQAGLKGFRIGDAQVSLKHANFIVNTGAAKASDIWDVIKHVRKVVLENSSISLTTEVVRLGRW